MEVILKEDVPQLGSRGDVVKVADGYGRNYLLPRRLAIEATAANRTVIEEMKAAALRRATRDRADAEALATQFEGVTLNFYRKAGDREHLFGSVTSADIAEELDARGFNVDRRKIHLEEPLKVIGEFDVPVKLHKDVTVHVKVIVNREPID